MVKRNEVVKQFRLRLEEFYSDSVQEVFGYLPSDFQGLSPAIALYVGGTLVAKATPKVFHKAHRLFIYFVAVYGVQGQPEWTEEKAQLVLGNLSDKLEDFVREYMYEEGFWTGLEFVEFTDVSPVKLVGRPYFLEIVPLLVHVY